MKSRDRVWLIFIVCRMWCGCEDMVVGYGDGEDMVVGYGGWSGHGCIVWGMEGSRFDLWWSRMSDGEDMVV